MTPRSLSTMIELSICNEMGNPGTTKSYHTMLIIKTQIQFSSPKKIEYYQYNRRQASLALLFMNRITLLILALAVLLAYSDTATADRNDPCRSGFRDGRRVVKHEWNRHFDSNCDYIDELDDETRRVANRTYRRARSWKEREFNRCARQGVQDMVGRYERLCASYHP